MGMLMFSMDAIFQMSHHRLQWYSAKVEPLTPEIIVGNTRWGSVVASTNTTRFGGSSKVLRELNAETDNI